MTRKKQFTNGTGRSGAAKYFTEQLAVSDYYRDGRGILQGLTFDHLKLQSRDCDVQVFTSLEQNVHPETGDKLTPRTNKTRQEWGVNKDGKPELQTVDNRRTGLDLTFVCPKTVSEIWMENEGEFKRRILEAFITAKDRAMECAQEIAKTRVRLNGQLTDRVTGNLLFLSVIHYDARPVGANVPDPLLHAHNYIFNLTFDPVENRLKAVELIDVIRFAETIDAVFISTLERGLTELGVGTERTADGKSFEVTGVLGKEIFSKRRNEILKEEMQSREKIETLTKMAIWKASQLGKTLDYDRVKADVRNRLGKQLAKHKRPISLDEKMIALRAEMTPEIRRSLHKDAITKTERKNWRNFEEAKEEIVHTAFKNHSVVHQNKVIEMLLRATGGTVSTEEAKAFAASDAFLRLDDEGHVTTRFVKAEEEWMLMQVKAGWDMYAPAAPNWEMRSMGIPIDLPNPNDVLALDQLRAVKFILNSKDFMMDVSGIAGSGKTKLLKRVYEELGWAGHPLPVMLAPTSASEKKLKEDFNHAMTVQKFDAQLPNSRIPSGTFIFIDEASMVSVPQMARIVSHAQEHGWRIVTLGDSAQHVSPERGDAIRILQESGSVRSTQLTETYRAKTKHLKACVLDLKAGGKRRELAYERLNVHGDILEVEDSASLREQAIRIHLECVRSGHIGILACPVHAEAREVAAIVRATLKNEGMIGKEDHTVRTLRRIDADGPELRDPRHYQMGRVIKFRTRVSGFKPGDKWEIVGQGKAWEGGNMLVELRRPANTQSGWEAAALDPSSKGQWNIYDIEEIPVSVGDQVRITEGFSSGSDKFKNNDIGKVKYIRPGCIHLEDGRSMDRDLVHLDQGVCITSYATQCRTVRQVVAICPILSFAEMSAKTLYVLVSRATHDFKLFTDCKEALREAVLRPGERRSVWDYTQSHPINYNCRCTIGQTKEVERTI